MSTIEKGDAFRYLVASHLSAAGFSTTNEVRAAFKKADVRALWQRDDLDGPATYLIETKDYAGTLPLDECAAFASQYGELVRAGEAGIENFGVTRELRSRLLGESFRLSTRGKNGKNFGGIAKVRSF